MIHKLRVIFSGKQKMKFVILFGILFVGSLLEFLGVSLVLPFVQLVMDPEKQDSRLLLLLGELFHVTSGRELLFLAGLLLIAVYILKNACLLLMKMVELRFIFNNRLELAGRLMRSYMEKPYTFHLAKNSSEVLQNVTFEVNKLYDLILYGMELVSDLLIIIMISAFLFWKDPGITLVVVVLMGLCSVLYSAFIRGRIEAYGRQNQIYNRRMLQAVHRALGGIKEIRLMAREGYFVRAYEENGRRYASSLKKSQFLQYMPKYLIETICVCGILSVVLLRLSLGVEIRELVPQLSVFAIAAFRLLPSVNQVNRLLGYIPQIIYLADDTIRRNIAFGIPDSLIDEEKVWKALQKAHMERFVKTLESGLDTRIGEAGVRLSGGQRQRIGIARALYQEPEILVLDEATSALDAETERAVMEAVENLRGSCTLLMIAHRTSTLEKCDQIWRVEGGRVTAV